MFAWVPRPKPQRMWSAATTRQVLFASLAIFDVEEATAVRRSAFRPELRTFVSSSHYVVDFCSVV